MLNQKLSLLDVKDVEGFCARICQRAALDLNHEDREDLLAYLIETAWELSLIYERGDPKYPPRFSVYAHTILTRRLTDWKRNRYGRTTWTFSTHTYTRPVPVTVSYEHELNRESSATSEGSSAYDHPTDQLGRALTALSRDPGSHGDTGDLVRLLRARGSDEAWRDDTRRETLPRRVA